MNAPIKFELETGDIILFKPKSFIGNIITWLTKSDYSHVALVVNNCILQTNRFVKSSMENIDLNYYNKDIHHVYRLKNITEEQKRKIENVSYKYIGNKYDYIQLIGLFLRITFDFESSKLNNLNKFICSEIIDRIYHESEVERLDDKLLFNITPSELLDKYELIKVI